MMGFASLIPTFVAVSLFFLQTISSSREERRPGSGLTLAFIICDKAEESGFKSELQTSLDRQKTQMLTLLKSILVTWVHDKWNIQSFKDTQVPDHLDLIIYSNSRPIFDHVTEEVGMWDEKYTRNLTLFYRSVSYPQELTWLRSRYTPCATFRLFLPQQLAQSDPQLDRLIYLDTDMLLLRNIRHLWLNFENFTQKTLVGSYSTNKENSNVVDLFHMLRKKDLVIEPIIVNIGLLMINLTNWRRSSNWIPWLSDIEQELMSTKYPDKGAICSFLSRHPDLQFQLENTWNIRPNCILLEDLSQPECNTGENGISLIHGSWRAFYRKDDKKLIRLLYNHFQGIDLSSKMFSPQTFLLGLRNKFQGEKRACARITKPTMRRQKYCANIEAYTDKMLMHLNKLE